MKEVFKRTEIGIKYAFLFLFLGVGTMVSSIMYAVQPVWDDLVGFAMIPGLIMLLCSLVFTWDLLAQKNKWHKFFGSLALLWTVLLLFDILSTFREFFYFYVSSPVLG